LELDLIFKIRARARIQIGSNFGTQLGPNFGILEPIFFKIIVLGKKV
jgi:hypothetical protein